VFAVGPKCDGDFVRAGRHDFTFVNGDELISVALQEFLTHLDKRRAFPLPFVLIDDGQTEFWGWQNINFFHTESSLSANGSGE